MTTQTSTHSHAEHIKYNEELETYYCNKCVQHKEKTWRSNNQQSLNDYDDKLNVWIKNSTFDALYDNMTACEIEEDVGGYEFRIIPDVVEPGYTDQEPLFIGDWNNNRKIADVLESFGYYIGWCDEWTECHGCYSAVRTQPDSYSWKQSFILKHSGLYCHECVKEDPETWLDIYVNNPDRALTINVDLTDHGFQKHNGGFESGWYKHTNDNPNEVYEELEDQYDEIIFKISSTGQFSTGWTVWVR